MTPEKQAISQTTDGQPPRPGMENEGAPAPINPLTGQHEAYWVLSAEERAKAFVRPLRHTYRHVGAPGPRFPLRDLTAKEKARYLDCGYVKFEDYQGTKGSGVGRFWTQNELDRVGKGCGEVTRMGDAIAQTYARDPHYYGSTFCIRCRQHLPVGEYGEFVWMDGDRETTERVGT